MTPPNGSAATWLVIAGVFVAGALGGAAARSVVWVGSEGPRLNRGDPVAERPREERRPSRRGDFGGSDRFVRYLERSLELTPDQTSQIAAILKERQEESEALLATIEPQMRETVERTEDGIRSVLTDEQRPKFEEIVKRGKERYGNGSFRRGGRRGDGAPRRDGPPR